MTIQDPIDKKILEILRLDGKASVRDIAERIDVSPATVSRKIKQMEQENVIKAYVSIIDDEEIGKGTRAVLLVRTIGDQSQTTIVEDISEMEDICNVFVTMGNYDLILTACTLNENALYNILKRIRTIPGVAWVDFASIVRRKKVLSTIIEENGRDLDE
ncbi:MAG: Lrp/AsnC family transcriptional regulator [Candidatus Bathyarchaeota archaeon]|nr:Lrp/AsnC family transcriptional regulator [Candidatus Bathyarchaeota archaeon]